MEEPFDPFYNVRKGGPKEKRIRRVELMGEHQPKPIYYIRAIQEEGEEFLSLDTLKQYYESRIGEVADIYRPIDSMNDTKEFALVGFYDPAHVQAAIESAKEEQFIANKYVRVDEAKPWLIDLYPKDPNAL